jgi:TetR/AcrR family transcriptional repressor of nem operon
LEALNALLEFVFNNAYTICVTKGRPKEFDEDQALQAAMAVFWKRGYDDASCDELLASMGINSGSMYATFGDKRALYDKAFDSYCQTKFAFVLGILNGSGSPLENVRELVRCWGNMDCKGCMVFNTLIEFGSESKGVGMLAKKVVSKLRQEFEEKLTAAKDGGELGKKANPKELAAFLVNTAQGLNVSAHAGVGKEAILGIVKTTLAVLC